MLIPRSRGLKGSTPALSSETPLPGGPASAGSSPDAARADHVHPLPSCADIGAAPADDLTELATATQASLDQKLAATHAALAALLATLPTTLPEQPGQLWINGNVLQIS